MPDMHAKTFRFVRYQYVREDNEWKRLDSGDFLTHSKSPKGVARQVTRVVPHINKDTDLVVFRGCYLDNREQEVCGLWCPVLNIFEGFDIDGDSCPSGFWQLYTKCRHYIKNYCGLE